MAYSKAVNRPVDKKLKERDVNNKLQLYGMYNGKLEAKFPVPSLVPLALDAFAQFVTESLGILRAL